MSANCPERFTSCVVLSGSVSDQAFPDNNPNCSGRAHKTSKVRHKMKLKFRNSVFAGVTKL